MNPKTKNGHNMFDMANMMCKAIKMKEIDIACYCAYELYGDFRDRMWQNLIELADCKEIKEELEAMQKCDDLINKGSKGYDRDPLFAAKAIVLLCIDTNENRNGINPVPDKPVTMEKVKDVKLEEYQIPDWTFDCHTLKGKRQGKTDLDMTITEEEALTPKRKNFFDDCSWFYAYNDDRKKGIISEKEWQKFLKFSEGKKVK